MKSVAVLSLLATSALAQNVPKPLSFNLKPAEPSPPAGQRTLDVMVGMGSPPSFVPTTLQAQPGDTIRFMFMGANNSVMQTTFDAPCQAKAGGFNSGFKPNPNNAMPPPTADLKVTDTQPLFMTSEAAGACGIGMVFSVNAPPNQPHEMFQSKAIATVPGLKQDAIVVDQPVQQVASTVSIVPGNVQAGATGAAGAAPSVVPGQGTTGNGQSCTCQCLCGSNAFPAGTNAGVGAFGGFLGMMPAGAMSAAPAAASSAPAPAAASAPAPAAMAMPAKARMF